jgi:hypothetical protein
MALPCRRKRPLHGALTPDSGGIADIAALRILPLPDIPTNPRRNYWSILYRLAFGMSPTIQEHEH